MSLEKPTVLRIPKIERLEGESRNAVSFSPERGGIITSLQFGGQEVLYFDESTFNDPAKNVRGGVPVLFPNAGPGNEALYPGLKQHGVARLSHDWVKEAAPDNHLGSFAESLTILLPTPSYPYMFRTGISGSFDEAGVFTLTQSAANLSTEKEMPVSMGLHPYFKVDNAKRKDIRFDFPGGAIAEERADVWMNDGTVSIDNPNTDMRVVIPDVGTLVLRASPEYKKIWIWSKPDGDFVCIEPVMNDEGGLVNSPHMIAPGAQLSAFLRVALEK